jgi:hypothetical protein
MTGGVAYMMRDSLGGHGYNQHSVHTRPLEVREELWVRMVLRRHLRLTNSPRALSLLSADVPLPFLRVEPIKPPCSITETWTATLAQLRRHDLGSVESLAAIPPKEPVLM